MESTEKWTLIILFRNRGVDTPEMPRAEVCVFGCVEDNSLSLI